MTPRHWTAFGDGALRRPLPSNIESQRLLEQLRAVPRVRDVVLTEDEVCLYFDPKAPPPDPGDPIDVEHVAPPVEPRLVTIRARYDGPDLAEVGVHASLGAEETIALHAGGAYTVAMIGFLPGFAYLRGVDPRLAVPRRSTPRDRVPAGAIGLAAGYTGVYPFASPGGWNLIASAVDFVPFDPARGAALNVGDRVRFERVG